MDFSHLAFELQWEQCFAKLDQWKSSMIDRVAAIHREKSLEIQKFKDKAEKDLVQQTNQALILDMNTYFQHPCILPFEIYLFKKKLQELKQSIISTPSPLDIHIQQCSLMGNIDIHMRSKKSSDQLSLNTKQSRVEYELGPRKIRLMTTSTNRIMLIDEHDFILVFQQTTGCISQTDMSEYTSENLIDICYSSILDDFLLLFEHSLWLWQDSLVNKIALVNKTTRYLTGLTIIDNSFFLLYDQGRFIDRWIIKPEWTLERRWARQDTDEHFLAISSNRQQVLFSTSTSILLCTHDMFIQHSINLIDRQQQQLSHFVFLYSHQIWLTIDRQEHRLYYFHSNDLTIKHMKNDRLTTISAISSMGDDDQSNALLALMTSDDNRLRIVSI